MVGAPAVAAALLALRRHVHSVPLLIAIALCASGLTAIVSFWAYYADPTVGQAWDFIVLFASLEVTISSLWKGNLDRDVLRQLHTPLLL